MYATKREGFGKGKGENEIERKRKPRILDKGRRVPLRLVFCVDHSFWGQVGWREREMERD